MKTNVECPVLENMLLGLADNLIKERRKTKPYKEMFEKGSKFTALFRHLNDVIEPHILDACDVLEEKHNLNVNDDQYNFLLALPLLAKISEELVEKKEGSCYCIDKAYFILSDQFKEMEENE